MISQPKPPSRRHLFAIGALSLAIILLLAAVAAPSRPPSVPKLLAAPEPTAVVARVPRSETDDRVKDATAISLDGAVALARRDIERSRELGDSRYLGRARTRLARWWSLPVPPAEVLLLRATIEQSLHNFGAARRDLDRLISLEPDNAQAQLTRAVVAIVQGDVEAARQSCEALRGLASELVVASCIAPVRSLRGDAAGAYAQLLGATRTARVADQTYAWAHSVLAELAVQLGNQDAAEQHLIATLSIDPEDIYAMSLLADLMLASGDAAGAARLIAAHESFESIDSLLVRAAIAERMLGGHVLADRMRQRIDGAAERNERLHVREEARFVLSVEGAPRRALSLAWENWAIQHELADARLLLEAGVAAHDTATIVAVTAWKTSIGVRDVKLDSVAGAR